MCKVIQKQKKYGSGLFPMYFFGCGNEFISYSPESLNSLIYYRSDNGLLILQNVNGPDPFYMPNIGLTTFFFDGSFIC